MNRTFCAEFERGTRSAVGHGCAHRDNGADASVRLSRWLADSRFDIYLAPLGLVKGLATASSGAA
jgi:hypothetical protein